MYNPIILADYRNLIVYNSQVWEPSHSCFQILPYKTQYCIPFFYYYFGQSEATFEISRRTVVHMWLKYYNPPHLQVDSMRCDKLIRVENKVNPFWSHSLPVGKDVRCQIASVYGIFLKHIV